MLIIFYFWIAAAAKDFPKVQKRVAELIKGRILVGHALRNDLKVIRLFYFILHLNLEVLF